jgi:AraC-like DNA-binding protein
MNYTEHPPCAALAHDLECIWFVVDDQRVSNRAPERVLPDGCFEWIFHLGQPFQQQHLDGRWENQQPSFFVGELTRFLLLQPGRTIATMGVRFRPMSAYRFLPLSMHVLTNDAVTTREIWGHDGRDLEDQVLNARSDEDRKLLLEAFVLRRLERAQFRPRFERAVSEILRNRGQLRVDHLATGIGWSSRQLEREFRSGVGVSPKSLARIIRFQNLLRLIGENKLREWTSLALTVGYADQSHMVREFREFSGQSPTEGEARDLGDLAHNFVAPHRLASLLGPDPQVR